MATIYVPDDILLDYAAEHGGTESGKEAIQQVVRENRPDGSGSETN